MAITVDGTPASGAQNSVATLTISVTITTGDLLVVGVGANDGEAAGAVTGITWNTVQALTKLDSINAGVAGVAMADLWYRIAPATGTHDVVVTISGNANLAAGCVVLVGTHQTTPFTSHITATNSSTTPTVTVTSAAGELVIDVVGVRGGDPGGVPGSGQTGQVDVGTGGIAAEMSTEAGAASVVMDWTLGGSANWAQVGGSVQPAGAAATTAQTMAAIGSELSGGGYIGRVLNAQWNDPVRRMYPAVAFVDVQSEGLGWVAFFPSLVSYDYEPVSSGELP